MTAEASPARPAPAASWQIVNPAALGAPRGWNNGMLAPARGRVLLVAGQIGASPDGGLAQGLAQQFGVALANVALVVEQAGGRIEHVGRLTIFVTDMPTYRASLSEVGAEYRSVFGKHFPAMSLVEVSALVHPEALVEVEATAVLPS